MTDRVVALTVLLSQPTHDDEVGDIVHAIQMVKGVYNVQPLVMEPEIEWAKITAKRELRDKLLDILKSA